MAVADFVSEKSAKGKLDVVKRYVGPASVLLVILLAWSLIVGPWIAEFRMDLAFLRAARIQTIQQQMQKAQQGQPEAK